MVGDGHYFSLSEFSNLFRSKLIDSFSNIFEGFISFEFRP